MAQSIVKRGSVVLIRSPFTDLTGAQVRPALVLTPDHLLPRLGGCPRKTRLAELAHRCGGGAVRR